MHLSPDLDTIGFAERLRHVKGEIRGVDWYPFGSLENLRALESLNQSASNLLSLARDLPLLDIGCADGDLAFWFESMGASVHAIDNPITNFNAMRGIKALHERLGSRLVIHELDLESDSLPDQRYGLALFLGTLYHLKNPFRVLEQLSRRADYCLVSTALTDVVPGLDAPVRNISLGYIVDEFELNRDATNYWILTSAGFQRMLERSGWEILGYHVFERADAGAKSDPTSRLADCRGFCLAHSRLAAQGSRILFGPGWHPPEGPGWRWTARAFSVRIERAVWNPAGRVVLSLFLPQVNGVPMDLRAFVNGRAAEELRMPSAGDYQYACDLPGPPGSDVRIDFDLSHALPPDETDRRERGIIVGDIALS